jgi:hypothetical protein
MDHTNGPPAAIFTVRIQRVPWCYLPPAAHSPGYPKEESGKSTFKPEMLAYVLHHDTSIDRRPLDV